MIRINKLDKSFGPAGTAAGTTLVVVGIAVLFVSLRGIVLLLIGGFVGFTSTSAMIDFEQKKVKLSNNFFGLIRIGSWMPVEKEMKIGVKRINKTWRNYSWSNRILEINESDFRIILYDSHNKQIMHLSKTVSMELANAEKENLARQLGVGVI